MKRNLFNFVGIAVLMITTTVSCQRDKSVTGVDLNETTLTLVFDEDFLLRATVEPADAANKLLSWESSDPKIADVVKGKVIAKSEGTATITVITDDGGHTATCRVTVIPPPDPTDPIETMILVVGGIFTMGCTDDDCFDNEQPNFTVQLSNYYIGKYPVTQKEWRDVMKNNPSHFRGDNLPVENIAVEDIETFLEKLNELYKPGVDDRLKYRLATEAEWEFAARGGTSTREYKFSGSNNIDEVAWFAENSAAGGQINERRTHPVGTKTANELGIYDMSGNVWEWCSDYYQPYSDLTNRQGFDPELNMWVNPQGPTVGAYHVARGGSWIDTEKRCRVAARSEPWANRNNLGFRLVLSAE